MPEGLTLTAIRAAMDEAERRVSSHPTDTPRAITVGAALIVEFADTFQVKVNAQAVTEAYHMALVDMPADVIVPATQRCLGRWAWGTKVPMPGDIRKEATTELVQRSDQRATLMRAEFYAARRKIADGGDAPDAAELERRRQIVRDLRVVRGLPPDGPEDERDADRSPV